MGAEQCQGAEEAEAEPALRQPLLQRLTGGHAEQRRQHEKDR
ncbi:hypothetical protein [Solimonas soli]|nr:hypothetical protein [Solimonas soli]